MVQKICQTSCLGCRTRSSSEWDCLSTAELRTIDKARVSLAYMPGDSVFSQGDDGTGVYCIQSGLIGLRRLDQDGNSTLIRLVHPGETIGYRSFLQNKTHRNSAEILLPRNTWEDKNKYDETKQKLIGLFQKNFEQYKAQVNPNIINAAPKSMELA